MWRTSSGARVELWSSSMLFKTPNQTYNDKKYICGSGKNVTQLIERGRCGAGLLVCHSRYQARHILTKKISASLQELQISKNILGDRNVAQFIERCQWGSGLLVCYSGPYIYVDSKISSGHSKTADISTQMKNLLGAAKMWCSSSRGRGGVLGF